jgi:hypothetical protein
VAEKKHSIKSFNLNNPSLVPPEEGNFPEPETLKLSP